LIQAVVIDNAGPKISCVSIALFSKTSRIASSIVGALLLAVLEGGEAFCITLTGAELFFAFSLNALKRGTNTHHDSNRLNRGSGASVGGSALGGINGSLATFAWETEGPT